MGIAYFLAITLQEEQVNCIAKVKCRFTATGNHLVAYLIG